VNKVESDVLSAPEVEAVEKKADYTGAWMDEKTGAMSTSF
jgi:hypothetical protein